MKAVCVDDYRMLAKRRLPPFLFDYIDGGAYGEQTLTANRADLAVIRLRQRVLRDVSAIDPSVELFGTHHALPIALGPVGIAGLYARRGETQAVRAAERHGIPFCLSTVSACTVEEVAAAATRPFWFQLYVMRDRAFLRDLLDRVRAAGCNTLVFTVDMPVPGTRYRDYRSGLAGASGVAGKIRRFAQACRHPRWAWDVGLRGRPHSLGNVASLLGKGSGLEDFFAWINRNFDPAVTWDDFAIMRQEWNGSLILKGILDPDDAAQAAAIGADGIVVSNHGGRQLDGAPSTAAVLPWIRDVVGDRLTILADGGVRSGLDVLRMLALGADSGAARPRLRAYALAARGEAGVAEMLAIIAAELRTAMALTGATSVATIDRDRLFSIADGTFGRRF